ncbi:MAG TPA: hypothetical protein DDW67_06370 [Elusimicrobia bacterium]|nr:hypothetical protein [Elusimicrobiota bacterium]
MTNLRAILLPAALLAFSVLPSRGQEKPDATDVGTGMSVIEKQDSLRRETETKIKKEILDPIFGEGKSFVFADVELEIIARKADQSREGVGVMQKYKEKGGQDGEQQQSEFLLPGIPKPKSIMGGKSGPPAAATGQQAQQSKGVQETRYGAETAINRFQVTVIHDETLAPEPVALARERVDDFLLPYKIKGQDAPTVVFKPTRFKSYNYLDDLKRPSVYLPLLYALLFLLLLMFLFGPLWGFFRKYIKALMAKPGAEVNIEDKREEGGGSGDEAGKQETEGHQSIDMNFLQKEEEKKEDEDDLMKKFEPFTYVNEENLKRLIYLFLMRKEEPWVIATVLSYMKPDLSRQALSMLPIEVQSKVALEALTVRQATREQIEAIDKDIKENIDFVMGGIERLSRMLEDADPATRKNIIEYLKTQKPDIYEKVKRVVMSFDDIAAYSDRDLQTIIRTLSNEVIARAVAKAPPQIVEKFFANMSQGAVSAIKEIIDYSGELSPVQVDEAQGKVIDAVKTLETEGKITARNQQSQEVYIVDSVDMTSASDRKRKFDSLSSGSPGGAVPGAAAPVSPEAQQYITAGADLYNQGRAEESLQYLEYAASLAPGSAEVQQYLGAAYYALGRVDESVAAYEKYASLSGDPAASEWLASFKQQVGR